MRKYLLLGIVVSLASAAYHSLEELDISQAHKYLKQQNNVVPVQESMAVGTVFAYAYINSHIHPADTTYSESLYLTVTNPGTVTANVNINSTYPGFTVSSPFTVAPGKSWSVKINPADIQAGYKTVTAANATFTLLQEQKSIWVYSDVPVKLVGQNVVTDGSSQEAFSIFPLCQLGKSYFAVMDESIRATGSADSTNVIAVVVTVDGTNVDIGGIQSKNVAKGTVVTLVSYLPLTSLPITADQPIAVITGAVCGFGYYSQAHCNQESIMLYPVQDWGLQIPFYKYLPEDAGELLLIVQDTTNISFDGVDYSQNPVTADRFIIVRTYGGIFIKGDKPIYVAAVGSVNSQSQGAPFFAHVPSSNLFTAGPVMFDIPSVSTDLIGMTHQIRVETTLDSTNQISIDGYYPNTVMWTRMGRSNYYFIDINAKLGVHSVKTDLKTATFAVTVYGYDTYKSYAFNPGLELQSNGVC